VFERDLRGGGVNIWTILEVLFMYKPLQLASFNKIVCSKHNLLYAWFVVWLVICT